MPVRAARGVSPHGRIGVIGPAVSVSARLRAVTPAEKRRTTGHHLHDGATTGESNWAARSRPTKANTPPSPATCLLKFSAFLFEFEFRRGPAVQRRDRARLRYRCPRSRVLQLILQHQAPVLRAQARCAPVHRRYIRRRFRGFWESRYEWVLLRELRKKARNKGSQKLAKQIKKDETTARAESPRVAPCKNRPVHCPGPSLPPDLFLPPSSLPSQPLPPPPARLPFPHARSVSTHNPTHCISSSRLAASA